MTLDRTLGIHVTAEDLASGKLARVKSEVAGIGQAGGTMGSKLGGAFKSLENGASRMGGYLGHAKGAIGGLLSGPLGILGLGAGLFTIGGALQSGIGKAQSWGLQIEKLQGITHNSAEQLSGLLAVTEKYGLSNERLSQIAGFSNKAVGNLVKGLTDTGLALAGTTTQSDATTKAQERLQVATLHLSELEANRKTKLSSLVAAQNSVADAQRALTKAEADGGVAVGGAAKFYKDYGFNILDASGKIKDFDTRLLDFADYWKNGAENPAIKAAAAAKIFGRTYVDLVPVLNLGKAGILGAADEAAKFGLVLTQDNVVALAKAREATRQWGDALGGLELQVGLALLPRLSDLATWATSFVSEHRDQIVGFFRDAGTFAATAAGTIGNLVGVIAGFWNSIPEGLRTAILTGFIANKTIKFLFGVDPAKAVMNVVVTGIENALASGVGKGIVAAGLGKLFVQPVWVTNPGFGGPGGGGPNPTSVVEAVGGAGLAGIATAIAGAFIGSAAFWGAVKLIIDANPKTQQNSVIPGVNHMVAGPHGAMLVQEGQPGVPGSPQKTPGGIGLVGTSFGRQEDATQARNALHGGDPTTGDAQEAASQARNAAFGGGVSAIVAAIDRWGYSPEQWAAIYARAYAAGGRSLINTLGHEKNKLDAIAIADSETSKFLAGTAGPFFRDGKNQTRLLASLEKDQAYFNAHGDTATAAKLGADLALLRDKIHVPDVTVNVAVATSVSVRDQQLKTRTAISTGRTFGVT